MLWSMSCTVEQPCRKSLLGIIHFDISRGGGGGGGLKDGEKGRKKEGAEGRKAPGIVQPAMLPIQEDQPPFR